MDSKVFVKPKKSQKMLLNQTCMHKCWKAVSNDISKCVCKYNFGGGMPGNNAIPPALAHIFVNYN